MTRNFEDPERANLSIIRYVLLTTTLFYPLWGYLFLYLDPLSYENMLGRFILVSIIPPFLVATYRSNWVKKRVVPLFETLLFVVTCHYFFILFKNNRDAAHLMGALSITFIASSCLFSFKSQCLFGIVTLLFAAEPILAGGSSKLDWYFFSSQLTVLFDVLLFFSVAIAFYSSYQYAETSPYKFQSILG